VGQDIGPNGVVGMGRMGDDPEALVGVMDEGDALGAAGGHGPVLAEEIQGVVGVETALEVEGQMEIEQWDWGWGAQAGAFFLEGFIPSLVGGQAGGAADMVVVVPVDLGLEQLVGLGVVLDALVGQEGDQTSLEGAEAALDLAFGLGVGGDAVGHAQGGEGALELGMGVEAIGWAAMAEEGQAVGVEAGWGAVGFQRGAEMGEMAPGGVAGHEGAGDDLAGVIVGGEDEGGIGWGRPPRMGRGVMLPEFADGGALPTPAGFGAGILLGHELREVLANIRGHGRAGAVEVEAGGQLIGQEGEVEGLAVGQEVGQEVMGGLGPSGVMVAAGGLGLEGAVVLQPLMAELVEAGRGDEESLRGGGGVESAGVEGGDDFLDVERRDAVSELFLFMGPDDTNMGALPPNPRSLSHCRPG
jgi:hypothetical protein